MENIEKGILEIINKNLPEQTAGELKAFIEKANRDKNDLKVALSLLNRLEEEIRDYEAKAKKFQEAKDLSRAAEIQRRINETKERQLEIESLKVKLEAAEYVKNNFQMFISNLTSNQEFSKSYFGNIHMNGNLPNGNYVSMTGGVDLTENKK